MTMRRHMINDVARRINFKPKDLTNILAGEDVEIKSDTGMYFGEDGIEKLQKKVTTLNKILNATSKNETELGRRIRLRNRDKSN